MKNRLLLPFRNIKKSFSATDLPRRARARRVEPGKHPQIPQIHADEFA
jgi:hypothetical protein